MEETLNKNKFLSFIDKYPLIIFAIISLLTGIISICLFFPGLSPFYPLYSSNNMSQDVNYYLYVGNELNNGKLPYIDIADQKGVFTFLLFQFGMKFGGIHMVRFIHIVLIGLLLFFVLMTIWELTKKYSYIILGTGLFLILFCIT